MGIQFSKMHHLGNDFVIVDRRCLPKLNRQRIAQLADRHRGIGFDQLLLVGPSLDSAGSFHYRIFNADGSEVTQCGNGALCVAKFIKNNFHLKENHFRLVTIKDHVIELTIKRPSQVEAKLGTPNFNPEKIPFRGHLDSSKYTFKTPFGHFEGYVLSLGNPHCILETTSVKEAPIKELGAYFNASSYFPEGCNIEFMSIRDSKCIDLRIYERGVGETYACGSGACAAVIAGVLSGRLRENVKVHLPGGKLMVRWEGLHSPVFLRGTPCQVFNGETVET